MVIHGTDLLGQPFDEPTTTLNFNLHGCRYTSKHHLPRNTWVTLELHPETGTSPVRARVAWVQRPHSVREFFQVAVELESPANIWGLSAPPADWSGQDDLQPASPIAESFGKPGEFAPGSTAAKLANFMEDLVKPMTNASPANSSVPDSAATAETKIPLLRELNLDFERQAREAVETAASQAREQLTARWAVRQEELLGNLKSEMQENHARARDLIAEIDRRMQTLRAENESAQEAASRLAQARLQMEAAEASLHSKRRTETSKEAAGAMDAAAGEWRERLASEMGVAQAQWNELLQSSLDGSVQRLVAQLSERSQEVLRATENKLTERFAEMQQPLAQAALETRESLTAMKGSLEEEVTRARFSLAEIEHSAGRMKEYSTQLEAASHDSLNELRRRLENILEAQTAEMNRRGDLLAAGLAQRAAPTLDSLGQDFLARIGKEAESRLAPHLDRVPELLRELSSREAQAEDSLRLHRERLRQASEQNHREVASQISATLANVRNDFEAARKDALSKWTEELDASGVRATHSASESIGRASEWFQQEARARLQVLVEQTLAAAGGSYEDASRAWALKFDSQLDEKSSRHIEKIAQRMEKSAGEMAAAANAQIAQAAELAASSFGQVLRGISDAELGQFTDASRLALQDRTRELEHTAQQLLRTLEVTLRSSIEGFHAQMGEHLEKSIAQGRGELAADFAASLERYRAERDTHQKEWFESLEQMSAGAAGKFQERLDMTGDSFLISSVRRLNEHGQNSIESLIRATDQSLRESCSRMFEGLAEMLRERLASATGASFPGGNTRDSGDSASIRNDAPLNRPNA